ALDVRDPGDLPAGDGAGLAAAVLPAEPDGDADRHLSPAAVLQPGPRLAALRGRGVAVAGRPGVGLRLLQARRAAVRRPDLRGRMGAIEFHRVTKAYQLGAGRTNLRETLASAALRAIGRRPAQADRRFLALDDVSFTVAPGE